jgi:hypothetical protein
MPIWLPTMLTFRWMQVVDSEKVDVSSPFLFEP